MTTHHASTPHPVIQALRILRLARGWSQAHVARQLGMSRTVVYGWETGRSDPGLKTAEAYAGLLGTEVALLDLESEGS